MTSARDRQVGRPSINRLPSPSPTSAAAAESLLRAWLADPERLLDGDTVGRRLTGNLDHTAPGEVARRAHEAGTILGVWDGSEFRFPAFQFDRSGQPIPRLDELLSILPTDIDASRQSALLWLYAPDAALGGHCPAEIFQTDPDRVINLRRRRMGRSFPCE